MKKKSGFGSKVNTVLMPWCQQV